jgi:hypothetical protein
VNPVLSPTAVQTKGFSRHPHEDRSKGNPPYPTAAEAGGISGISTAAYPARHG